MKVWVHLRLTQAQWQMCEQKKLRSAGSGKGKKGRGGIENGETPDSTPRAQITGPSIPAVPSYPNLATTTVSPALSRARRRC